MSPRISRPRLSRLLALLGAPAETRLDLCDGRVVFGRVRARPTADDHSFTLDAWGVVEPMTLTLADVVQVERASVGWAEFRAIRSRQRDGVFVAQRSPRGMLPAATEDE